MSGGNNTQGAVYSPLPQTISDTDSSEEELHSNARQNANREANEQLADSNKDTNDKRNGEKMDYRPLGNPEVVVNGFTGQLPPPTGKTENGNRMSCMRKLCFMISVLFCILAIVIFLWGLPCDLATCSPPKAESRSSWEQKFSGMEIKGNIELVPNSSKTGHNIISMFHGEKNFSSRYPRNAASTKNVGGLVCLSGLDGKLMWMRKFSRLPLDLDCNLVDVDGDGVLDCIVIGVEGLLSVVNPISGLPVWYLHNHAGELSETKFRELDFPLMLPDLDGDKVNELAVACSMMGSNWASSSGHNTLLLISGRMGSIIGQPYTVPSCKSVHNLMLEKDLTISYTCQDSSDAESLTTVTIQDLYSKVSNDTSSVKIDQKLSESIKQHRSSLSSGHSITVSNHHLTIENKGRCPQCDVHVRISDNKLGYNTTIWSYNSLNAYGISPVSFYFNKSIPHPVSGFIMKFWQWDIENASLGKKRQQFFRDTEDVPRKTFIDESELDSIQPVLFHNKFLSPGGESEVENPHGAKKRSTQYVYRKPGRNNASMLYEIKERVVILTFNETENRAINASQSDVTQICQKGQSDEICQPYMSAKDHSLLIADLNGDGSHELISYLSTYTRKEISTTVPSMAAKWQLESRIKVIHLEEELPKLYESVSRQ